jgi:4-hydroxythreonine-4-phosphate dehydrogenase
MLKFNILKIDVMQETPTHPLPKVALSHGDLNGIGYEIMLKTFADARMFEMLTPVLYGQSKAFSYYKKNFGMDAPNYALTRDVRQVGVNKFNIINIVENELKIEPGAATEVSTQMSVISMKKAFDDVFNGLADALVMAPDSPKVAQYNQEFLLSHYKDAAPLRVMVNDMMRIALATDDMPLEAALVQIDERMLATRMATLSAALKTDFGINAPKIAVMGINPHGVSGADDKVLKAVEEAQRKDILAFGPFSASQLFVNGQWKKYDAVLAMYYDQGVFPLKMMTVGGSAYYWAGLPVVCAAPMHGPAFDVANQNRAEPDSYRRAVYLAVDIVNKKGGC